MKQISFLIILLTVCGSSYATTPPDTTTTSCDTLWLKSGKIMLVTLISDNGSQIKFTDCPPNEIVSTIPKSSTKLSPRDSIRAAIRATQCDTIFVSGGEIITGRMKYYNSRKVVYTGCCATCTTEKILKRNDVDSIHYANGNKVGTDNPANLTIEPDITTTQIENKPPKEETVYSPEEKEQGLKRMKIFGWIGLSMIAVAATAATILVAVASANIIAWGAIFFAAIIVGLVMATLYVRNKKKAGREKDRKKKDKK